MTRYKNKVISSVLFLVAALVTIPAVAVTPEEAFRKGLQKATIYTTSCGHQLRYTCFRSPVEGPKDTVFFIQGRGTFLEFYEVLVVPLLERGMDVWMYDLSGQGGSTRLVSNEQHNEITAQCMQHVDSFDHYIDDADAFLKDVVLPQMKGKIFLGGYSTGGHVALRYLQRHTEIPFEAAFLFSPMLSLRAPLAHSVLPCLLWTVSWVLDLDRYAPGADHEDPIFKMGFQGNPYTSDEECFGMIQCLCEQHRPLMMGGVSLGWVKAASDSVGHIWKASELKTVQIPVWIATGGADGVVDVSYNAEFARELRNGKHVFYLEGRHELFREIPEIHKQLWSDLDEFFAEIRK